MIWNFALINFLRAANGYRNGTDLDFAAAKRCIPVLSISLFIASCILVIRVFKD